jgi:hypothetical protein
MTNQHSKWCRCFLALEDLFGVFIERDVSNGARLREAARTSSYLGTNLGLVLFQLAKRFIQC